MNGLSLCSGIGGIDLGLRLAVPGYQTVCYVEIEPYCQEVLLARMEDGVLDHAPIWDDLRTFDAALWRGSVDVIHGGYPCQPFSVAGKRLGEADLRHLWPDIARVICECEPEWCFFENVAGHLRLGFDVVARDLVSMGYRIAAGLFTAAEVGAPHKRQRLFCLAHAPQYGRVQGGPPEAQDVWLPGGGSSATDPHSQGSQKRREQIMLAQRETPVGSHWWTTEPDVGRVAHGVPARVDRLKALGNGVVPAVAALAFTTLAGQLSDL